jgi:predicted AAA+ superfamily ATPase
MERVLTTQILADLKEKMVFLGGPRQVGKTTLAQSLSHQDSYLNWDYPSDRKRILKLDLPNTKLWIFDEIHKYKQWRNLIKGIYDKNKSSHQILITGSARLDLMRRGGDSLQGRYHFLRLYPLSLNELNSEKQSDLDDLMAKSGFPEPFLGKVNAQRWSNEYRHRVLRDDVASVETLSDLGEAEHLLINLPEKVGSPLSINSLREDINVSHKTISRWLNIFENFYAVFRISPFNSSKIRALKKEQKHYHFDWTLVENRSFRFENLVAVQLLTQVHLLQDTLGEKYDLCYFRDKDKREVDFVITHNRIPVLFVECKQSDAQVSEHLVYLKRKFQKARAFQISLEGIKDYVNRDGVRVLPGRFFLRKNFMEWLSG